MVETALDQVQRLFGRGFLLAALVPTIIFAAAAVAIWEGLGGLRTRVEGWFEGGFSQFAPDILLAIAGIYLFAYVLYGIRAALHRVYQGRWPGTLRLLVRPGLRLERRAWKASRRRLDERTAALDVRMWVEDRNFGAAYSDRQLTGQEASDLLGSTGKIHKRMVARLERGKSLSDAMYGKILSHAFLVCANRNELQADQQAELDRLIEELRRQYNDNKDTTQESIQHLAAVADREQMAAYEDFVSSFSEDERWLRPTRLGNVMSGLDAGMLNRYGINLGVIWPRLVHVVPAESRSHVDDANIYLDFSVIMSFLSLLTAGVAGVALRYGEPRDTILGVVAIVLSVAFFLLFYRLSILAARTFAAQIWAVVDLFRLKLLDALDLERPDAPSTEKETWTDLRRFIVQAEPTTSLRFKSQESPTPGSSQSPAGVFRSLIRRLGLAAIVGASTRPSSNPIEAAEPDHLQSNKGHGRHRRGIRSA